MQRVKRATNTTNALKLAKAPVSLTSSATPASTKLSTTLHALTVGPSISTTKNVQIMMEMRTIISAVQPTIDALLKDKEDRQ